MQLTVTVTSGGEQVGMVRTTDREISNAVSMLTSLAIGLERDPQTGQVGELQPISIEIVPVPAPEPAPSGKKEGKAS